MMKKTEKGASSPEEDIKIMRKVAQRDTAAFTLFYDLHAKLVLAFLSRLLKNRVESEDILQETFWQVWRQAGAYDPTRGTPMAWVMTIARSRGMDRLRQLLVYRRRDAGSRETLLDEMQAAESVLMETITDTKRLIGRALLEIPKEQREAIALSYFDGFTHEEIANNLNIPIGTIKTRIRLGMSHLHEVLQKGEQKSEGAL